MTPTTARNELLRLLDLDYKNTNEFIKGVVATSATIRGWSITLSLALLSVAFDRHLWQVAALAALFVLMFALVDAYHSWLYSEALSHARFIERVLGLYYVSMTRGQDDPKAVDEFETELEVYKFGLISSLTRFRLSNLRQARPRLVLIIIYGVLMVASLLSVGLVLALDRQPGKTLVCSSVGKSQAGYYRCVDQGTK